MRQLADDISHTSAPFFDYLAPVNNSANKPLNSDFRSTSQLSDRSVQNDEVTSHREHPTSSDGSSQPRRL